MYRWILCAAAPRLTPRGRFVDYVGSCVDISTLHDAELQNQRQLAELSHVSRVASMGQLTVSVAHEVNQPLTGVIANSEAALRILDTASPPLDEVHEILADIRSDGRRAAEIIRRMRSLLQKNKIVRQRVDVNEAVRDVIQLLRREAMARKVALTFEPNAKAAVCGDYVHLQQVIMNLVLNAVEETSSVPEARRRVHVQTEIVPPHEVVITVSDTGPGIPSDARERLFEPFYSTKGNGLGMGLAIARSIVEAHNGSISAESNQDGGATFRIKLPPFEEQAASDRQALDASTRTPAVAHAPSSRAAGRG